MQKRVRALEGLIKAYQLINNISAEQLRFIELEKPIGPQVSKQRDVAEAIELTTDAIRKNFDAMTEWHEMFPGPSSQPWMGAYLRGEEMQSIELPQWDDTWLDQFEKMSWATEDFTAGTYSAFQSLGSGFNEMIWGMKLSWQDLLSDMLKMLTGTLIQMGIKMAAFSIIKSIPGAGGLLSIFGAGLGRQVSPTVSGDVLARQLAPSLERLALSGHSRLAVR